MELFLFLYLRCTTIGITISNNGNQIKIMGIINMAQVIEEGAEEISEALDGQILPLNQKVQSNSSPTTSKSKAKIMALFIHSK